MITASDGPTAPLADVRASDGATAGGKGANLGELVAAGFPVPRGFVLLTPAYARAAREAGIDPSDPRSAAERLRAVSIPTDVADAIRAAYREIGGGPVAVRSSATAEDLPGASFAGQQDTYLGIEGDDALLDAVRRCWASLWNERAVSYRRQGGVDDRGVALAVVVQRMIDARAAGVLFTADPITGRRARAVIDAAPGLGDAVVSGAVTPDHYVADARSGQVLERALRAERPVLEDALVHELALLGSRIESLFGSPQDVEFAVDHDARIWIVQSRPITTLYPLPESVPHSESDLRVLFSFNVAQGYLAPITPMGLQAYRLIVSGAASRFGVRIPDPIAGPRTLVEAGDRLFLDVTPLLRNPIGRELFRRGTAIGETRTAAVVDALTADVRLASPSGSRLGTLRRIVPAFIRSGVPGSAIRLFLRPDALRDRYLREIEDAGRVDLPADASSVERIDAVERLLLTTPPKLLPRVLGMVIAGALSFFAARSLLGASASEDEARTLTRGAPHNPTTEMDLSLWALATEVRADSASRRALLERSPEDLANGYRTRSLPARLQSGLASFLGRYGMRAVGEIDLGVPRWSEDPAHILGALANYLRFDDTSLAPDALFERGAREAEDTAASILARAHGPKRVVLRFLLRRVRALIGLREVPKFTIVRLVLSRTREILRPVGAELAAAGRIGSADDIYFLRIPEARRALAGEDMRALVAERRARYAREMRRRHIPRVLLSDGTDAEIALVPARTGALRGSPASPGSVTGRARVVRAPQGARLEPGEILVAPSTDPGWTPLFLTAGGLVMEMGGMMSHGAVVAREYGIPAVVGVPDATDRIATGQRVTVDGSSGSVGIEEPS